MNFEKQVTLTDGKKVLLRYPQIQDVVKLQQYINTLSQEDTYLLVSGETFSQEEEQKYLNDALKLMKDKNKIQILAFHNEQIIGNVEVNRMTKQRKRSLHVGEIAISVAKAYRGLGLGKILIAEIIKAGKSLNLRQLYLTTFSINDRAKLLYKKMGFQIAGEIPGQILYKNKYIGQTIMYLPLK